MIAGVADTHTAIWYLFNDERLSRAAGEFIDRSAGDGRTIAISSVTLVEIVYLIEKGRVHEDVYKVLCEALADTEHVFIEAPLTSEIADTLRRIPRAEVPDMPDRIVAATALRFGVPAISKDGRIKASSVQSVW